MLCVIGFQQSGNCEPSEEPEHRATRIEPSLKMAFEFTSLILCSQLCSFEGPLLQMSDVCKEPGYRGYRPADDHSEPNEPVHNLCLICQIRPQDAITGASRLYRTWDQLPLYRSR